MAAAKHRFIAIAGVMGSGKTTACRLLSDRLGFELLEESVDGNSFLPLFYRNPKRWALATQLFYLHERAEQLRRVAQLLKKTNVIQDSPIHGDYLMYAKAHRVSGMFTDAEFALYEKLFDSLVSKLPVPDLIVHLDASPRTLAKRIRARGRDFEQTVDLPYLKLLSKLQHEWLSTHTLSPILVVKTDALNLAANPAHQDTFAKLVTDHLRKIPA